MENTMIKELNHKAKLRLYHLKIKLYWF